MSILTETESYVKMRRQWLNEGQAALKLLKLLPVEVQELDGGAADVNSGWLYLNIRPTPDIREQLEKAGAHGFVYRPIKHTEGWWLTCRLTVPGIEQEVHINVNKVDNPHNCRLEPVESWEKVTKYKAVCNEDSSELQEVEG